MPSHSPSESGIPNLGGLLAQAWHAGGDTLSSIAGSLLEPVTCTDRQGRFLYANDAALRALDLFGGPSVNDLRLIELCSGSDALRITAHDRAVVESGEATVRDERFAAAGYAHHWQVTRLPLRNPDGAVAGLLSLWIERRARPGAEPGDAAARREGAPPEEELRANAERFRHLVETLGDVYWILDYRRMRRLYVSPACERLWELPTRVLYAGSGYWLEHVYREDREQVEAAFAELAHGRDFVCEYRIVRGNGSLAWVRDRAVAVFDQDLLVDRVIGVCEDISEQRDLVSGMLERERRLDLALGASGLHVWTFDVGAHRLSVAPTLCALLGLTSRRCTMPGAWRRQVHADDRAALDRGVRRCLTTGEDLDLDFRVTAADHTVHWLSVRATRIDGEAGGRHLYGVAADVTERRADELRLRDNERQLRTLNDTVPIGIARCTRDRRYRFANRAYAHDLLGVDADAVSGRSIADLVGEGAMHLLEPYLSRVLQGESVTVSSAIPFKATGVRHIRARLVPERDTGGSVSGWIEVVEDVTERAKVERLLYQRDREFKTLVENAPDIIARLDRELRYRYINAAVESALGTRASDFIGRSSAELDLPAPLRETVENGVRRVFETEREYMARFDLDARAGPDGSAEDRHRHFQARFVPEFARGETRTVESVLMIVYDVTAAHRSQRERERLLSGERTARERAEAASRARDQFLSIVSHELRSPLNAIQSWTSVLETQMRGETPPVAQRALTGIRTGVDQQVRLIEDLLDATRILSGRLGLAISDVRLAPVVETAVARVQDAAAARGIVIDTQLDRVNDGVQGDPQRLEQIVWNLLTNAIKFSPSGGKVRTTLEREGSTVRLCVSDQGKGFDPSFLPQIFDWFQREDTSSQRRQDGLGLGLALVRHLTELQGGHVTASSPGPGKGATFELRLPLAAAASAVRDDAAETDAVRATSRGNGHAPVSLSGVQVMLIDDKAEAREALGALLTGMEASVSTFGSGAEGLAWLRDRGPAHGVDVLLCDLAMPVQDGFATLLRLRALEDELGVPEDHRLPAIAVTAFAQHEDRQRALNAGFALHVAKPVSPTQLFSAIGGQLRRHAPLNP